MKMMRVLTMAGVACVALAGVSCKEKGPAEKAGEKIDRAAEKAADKIDGSSKGLGEKIGEKIDDGAAKVEDKVKDALDTRPGEPVRDAIEEAKQ